MGTRPGQNKNVNAETLHGDNSLGIGRQSGRMFSDINNAETLHCDKSLGIGRQSGRMFSDINRTVSYEQMKQFYGLDDQR